MSVSSYSIISKKSSKIIAAVCAAVILTVGLTLFLRDDSAAPGTASQKADISLYFSPGKQTLSKGQELSLSVWANPATQSVNTVEADISYPTDYFEFVGTDGSTSSFPMAVPENNKEGLVSVVRGSTTPLQGNELLVAVVKFKAKDKAGAAQISFTKDSKLFASTGNEDILSKTVPGNYVIK